ncbi:acyl-CoA-binding domain-containing protein [Ferrimonas senticii]|uniref:acyl-CoA-binding domain-containing protein n=1 Tax=Ferrimonas senticii TaxID=394566 RepID=UPI00041A1489|nr:acyl-CoA-binding protein [Ferrimonas senticii]
MERLQQQFQHAKHAVTQLPKTLDSASKLRLYGLHQQALIGDCNKPVPAPWDAVAFAKYGAWHDLKGMTTEQAMRLYIELVEKLQHQHIRH